MKPQACSAPGPADWAEHPCRQFRAGGSMPAASRRRVIRDSRAVHQPASGAADAVHDSEIAAALRTRRASQCTGPTGRSRPAVPGGAVPYSPARFNACSRSASRKCSAGPGPTRSAGQWKPAPGGGARTWVSGTGDCGTPWLVASRDAPSSLKRPYNCPVLIGSLWANPSGSRGRASSLELGCKGSNQRSG